MIEIGYKLGGKWKITSIIGEGACAKVYSVEHIDKTKQPEYKVVAKCIETGENLPSKLKKEQERILGTLNRERLLLAPGQSLSKFKYRPRVPTQDSFGKDNNINVSYLILERLDEDLSTWCIRQPNHTPTIKQIADIGIQMIEGFEFLHYKGLLFVDVKPDNFMLRGKELAFIDCKLTPLQYTLCL